jgi:hypothetical protein
MKTKAELEQDIVHITMKIQKEFPELSKYIAERPDNFSGTDKNVINIKNLKEYYNSLAELLEGYSKTHTITKANTEKLAFPGYPLYPPSEDIYNHGKKEMELDPNDISKNKVPNEKESSRNEKNFNEDRSGDDLDIPGSELDNEQESVGSEDEENNYYSLGGDGHNDLEENNT